MTRQSVACDATEHWPLLNRRYTAEDGGRVILAAGTGGNSVELRAPQGEATKFDYSVIADVANNNRINSDVLRALNAVGAFRINSPPSWPNPSDLSVPAQNPTTPRCTFNGDAYALHGSAAMHHPPAR